MDSGPDADRLTPFHITCISLPSAPCVELCPVDKRANVAKGKKHTFGSKKTTRMFHKVGFIGMTERKKIDTIEDKELEDTWNQKVLHRVLTFPSTQESRKHGLKELGNIISIAKEFQDHACEDMCSSDATHIHQDCHMGVFWDVKSSFLNVQRNKKKHFFWLEHGTRLFHVA